MQKKDIASSYATKTMQKQKKKLFVFDDLGVKETPTFRKQNSQKKVYLYRSTRQSWLTVFPQQ